MAHQNPPPSARERGAGKKSLPASTSDPPPPRMPAATLLRGGVGDRWWASTRWPIPAGIDAVRRRSRGATVSPGRSGSLSGRLPSSGSSRPAAGSPRDRPSRAGYDRPTAGAADQTGAKARTIPVVPPKLTAILRAMSSEACREAGRRRRRPRCFYWISRVVSAAARGGGRVDAAWSVFRGHRDYSVVRGDPDPYARTARAPDYEPPHAEVAARVRV